MWGRIEKNNFGFVCEDETFWYWRVLKVQTKKEKKEKYYPRIYMFRLNTILFSSFHAHEALQKGVIIRYLKCFAGESMQLIRTNVSLMCVSVCVCVCVCECECECECVWVWVWMWVCVWVASNIKTSSLLIIFLSSDPPRETSNWPWREDKALIIKEWRKQRAGSRRKRD